MLSVGEMSGLKASQFSSWTPLLQSHSVVPDVGCRRLYTCFESQSQRVCTVKTADLLQYLKRG